MAPPPPLPPNRPTISILNIQDGETVHQRFLLVYGETTHQYHAAITVTCRNFPATTWPCAQQQFKALVHLDPGPNTVTFTTPSSTLAFHVYYLPLLQNPPLKLVIWAAKDSPLVYDTPPQKRSEQGVAVAMEKLRLAGYLWQSFCAEQMHRHGFGRRTFRLEEAWLPDTTAGGGGGDSIQQQQRHTAVVRVLRSTQHSLQTIRDARRAQQNPKRDESVPSLFDLFMEDLRADPELGAAGGCHVAGLILDAHWDTRQQLVMGHAALGGGAGELRLGMFGSHALHAFPRSIHDIVDAMMDTTPTDTRYVANDANESGCWWKALNVGMGAMLHEVGHMFTLSHTPTGLMARGFNQWNRTFMIQEPGRAGIITPDDEAGSKWHRVDVIRLRTHPAFRLPLDTDRSASAKLAGPSFMPTGHDALEISSPAGMTMVEVWVNGRYATHFEYNDDTTMTTLLHFSLSDLQQASPIPIHPNNDTVTLEVTTPFQQTEVLDNMVRFLHDSHVRLPNWPTPVLKGKGCGNQGLGGGNHKPMVVVLDGVVGVRAYSGDFLDGLEFIFKGSNSGILLGKKGGHANAVWSLREGEVITGLAVRCGAWVDGVGLLTNQQRSSPWFGGQGGGLIMAVPPAQHRLVGLYSTAGAWMDQIGIYYQ
ncbi:unnamed protein product [Absidia cylindrospora]